MESNSNPKFSPKIPRPKRLSRTVESWSSRLPEALRLRLVPLVAGLLNDPREEAVSLFARRWIALFKENDEALSDALAAFLPLLEDRTLPHSRLEQAFREIPDAWVRELESGWQQFIEENTRTLHAVNAQLKQVDRARADFISTLSHELRTPLTAIFGSCEMLAEDFPLSKEQGDFLNLIQSSADHIHSLIEDILDFSKLEAGKLELHREPVDFAALAASAIEFLTPLLHEKDQQVTVDFPDLPPVLADAMRLRQVLLNLLSNAVKFTPEGGHISVQATPRTGLLLVEVRDDGVGISPEHQQEIFERFKQLRQANPKSARGQKGTGLGLPISRFLVELHGGEIGVESVLGQGSIFRFTIPLA